MSILGLYLSGETLPTLSYELSSALVGLTWRMKIYSSLSFVVDIFYLYDFMALTDLVDLARRFLSGVRSKAFRGPRLFTLSRISILE